MHCSRFLFAGAVSTAALCVSLASPAHASSHREALDVLSNPCADNTDLYAWVDPDTRDK